ncbi:lysophospholipid acyltransferase family protein [Isoalcanivorax indicus]|uniref:lysophospholipid acyltransferase family protein n=1 Tax=Isoalcanivorax indicus TaxID=2202653 RepID=UPI000DBA7886|nr:lysophospholipid acyltransferase family protein [Isoalcanivorax indicus]
MSSQQGVLGRRRGASPWPPLRRLWRLLRVLLHIGYGLWLALRLRAVQAPHTAPVRRAARQWAAQLLRLLRVEVVWCGPAPQAGAFLASNHVSWLDIPVLCAHGDVHFLSKAEVQDWPLVGRLALAAGTLFIRRGSGESRLKADEIAAHLRSGRTICVFPEGTTTDGHAVRRFFRPLFAAPVQAAAPVQPVALRYRNEQGHPDSQVPFIGDDAFHTHLWALLLRDRIRVTVTCCAPLPAAEVAAMTPEQLAETTHALVQRALSHG